MGCGASSAKPAELSPPARAAAAKSKLEELKNPKSVAPAASGQAAIDPRLQQDNRAALGTSATPAVKKYALAEDFYKPHTPSVRVRVEPCADGPFLKRCCRCARTFSNTAASSPRTRPPSASSSKSSTRSLRALLPRAISGTWSQSTKAQSLTRSSSSAGTTSTGGARRKAPAAASTYANLCVDCDSNLLLGCALAAD